MVPRAHGTPTMKGMEADDLLCSRNARPQQALVGRAQWKINQPPSLEEITSKLGGSMDMDIVRRAQLGTKPGHPLKEGNERAWMDTIEYERCSRNARPQQALVGRAQ